MEDGRSCPSTCWEDGQEWPSFQARTTKADFAVLRTPHPMFRWRLIVLAVLWLITVALFAGMGAWSLYESGTWYWIWWTLAGLLGW